MKKKLERLLALAQLEVGGDEARKNEARNAAYTMVQLAKQHGITIFFGGGEVAVPGGFQDFVQRGAAEVVAEVFVPSSGTAHASREDEEAMIEWVSPKLKRWPQHAKKCGARLMPWPRMPIEQCYDCKRSIERTQHGFVLEFAGGIVYFHPSCLKKKCERALSNAAR